MIPKFRAWHKDSQTMYEVKSLVFTLKRVLGVNRSALYPERTLDLDDDSTILMQSTGIIDKNGVEVFEGDIISYEGDMHEFMLHTFAGVALRKLPDGEFQTHGIDSLEEAEEAALWLKNEAVVIGNIHENPELLEANNEK